MQTDNLSDHTGEWLRGAGPESDIVLSSRARLARNLSQYPFTSRASDEQKRELEAFLKRKVMAASLTPDMRYVNLEHIPSVDRLLLVERHLISREHAAAEGARGVAFGRRETISLMVNEEDHLRIQVIASGLQLKEAWHDIDTVDRTLEKELNYAFSTRFGYLPACPTNVGTGLRASVMLHLPALAMTRQIEKVFNAVSKLNLAVRGLYGEGTQASGDLYQISNQITLGHTEEDIVERVSSVIPKISDYERRAREALLNENREKLQDRVSRSYSLLRSAYVISSEETMHLLSQVRMGVNLRLLEDVPIKTINELFVLALPAHLQKLEGTDLDSEQRNVVRARFLRERLATHTP